MDESIENFTTDVKQLKFKRIGVYGGIKKYMVFNNESKMKIKIKDVYLPFGIETFNGNQILNVELYPKKSNVHNNIESLIYSFEETAKNKEFYQGDVKKNITECIFYNNLKCEDNKSILRTYVGNNMISYVMLGTYKTYVTSNDLKATTCDIEIELGGFWINDTTYGFTWYVKEIQVKH